MNQQILTNNETDQTKGEAELEILLFDDLNLTDEQLAEIKGGPSLPGSLSGEGKTVKIDFCK